MASNGTCAVCASPAEVRDGINAALRVREPLRDIVKRSGFSRSGLSRHRRNCLNLRREDTSKNKAAVLRHRDSTASAGRFGRVFVAYADSDVPPELGPDDWIIRVEYFQPALHQYGNPAALVVTVYDEAVREHLARYPNARLAGGAAPPSEFLPSEPADDEFLPVVNAVEPPEPEPLVPAPEPQPCEHTWHEPAAGVRRCIACGHQEPIGWTPNGVRRDYQSRPNSICERLFPAGRKYRRTR